MTDKRRGTRKVRRMGGQPALTVPDVLEAGGNHADGRAMHPEEQSPVKQGASGHQWAPTLPPARSAYIAFALESHRSAVEGLCENWL